MVRFAGRGARGELSAAEVVEFRDRLMGWYRLHARKLPWRGVADPYKTWLSETMLQQTRVAAVVDHYHRFLEKYPALVSLALAGETEVLAAWSGLGYYRRARMLLKTAQFVVRERGGVFPSTAPELRTLPGIGEYTSAAIASIAFGESVAAVDGNVERVLLRTMGRAEEPTAAGRALVRSMAGQLVPERSLETAPGEDAAHGRVITVNAAGDHNQAMMELGAMICLPRGPLCLECPVYALCRTRGEHERAPRKKMRSSEVAHLLSLRKQGVTTEVLLAKRPEEPSLMAGMYELPPLALEAGSDALTEREPVLRVRHAITNTNYYVRVFAASSGRGASRDRELWNAVPVAEEDLFWTKTTTLGELPLTGLTKKVLERLNVMAVRELQPPSVAAKESQQAAEAKRKVRKRQSAVVDLDEDHDSF